MGVEPLQGERVAVDTDARIRCVSTGIGGSSGDRRARACLMRPRCQALRRGTSASNSIAHTHRFPRRCRSPPRCPVSELLYRSLAPDRAAREPRRAPRAHRTLMTRGAFAYGSATMGSGWLDFRGRPRRHARRPCSGPLTGSRGSGRGRDLRVLGTARDRLVVRERALGVDRCQGRRRSRCFGGEADASCAFALERLALRGVA